MTDWQDEVIEKLRERLRQEEEKAERLRRIDGGALAFWDATIELLNGFAAKVKQECGNNLFSIVVVPISETSTPVYSLTYKSDSGIVQGGLSWNRSQRQITQNLPQKSESFALGFNDGRVDASGSNGGSFNPEQIAEYFIRSITGLDGGSFGGTRRSMRFEDK
jgi:hypothetical protein